MRPGKGVFYSVIRCLLLLLRPRLRQGRRLRAATPANRDDTLKGEVDADTLNGGVANDDLDGGTGTDIIRGTPITTA
jgi:Ca2+-binding RTX toxin-like protein